MLTPLADESGPAATAEAARLYVLAIVYAVLGGVAWLLAGRRLSRTSKEI